MEKMVEFMGKNYVLYYTVNSMCAMEERAGKPLVEALKQEYSAARLILWGGLIDRQPEITLDGAGELIGAHLRAGGTLGEVVDICAEAMRDAGFFGPPAPATAPERGEACAKNTRG